MKLPHALIGLFLLVCVLALTGLARAPKELRLYVMDCGGLTIKDPTIFGLSENEIETRDLSDTCYLVVHRKGVVLFDTGMNEAWLKSEFARTYSARINRPLMEQLAEIGYAPDDIDYLVLSHLHNDHIGNANDFAHATWLVQAPEREAMFSAEALKQESAQYYKALQTSKTEILNGDRDIFGDGAAVIKSTPGHTPGSQSLFVKLQRTGPVLLSGDLWQFPAQRSLGRVPTFEFDKDKTIASRAAMERLVKETGAQVWIGHDSIGFAERKKAPAYYD